MGEEKPYGVLSGEAITFHCDDERVSPRRAEDSNGRVSAAAPPAGTRTIHAVAPLLHAPRCDGARPSPPTAPPARVPRECRARGLVRRRPHPPLPPAAQLIEAFGEFANSKDDLCKGSPMVAGEVDGDDDDDFDEEGEEEGAPAKRGAGKAKAAPAKAAKPAKAAAKKPAKAAAKPAKKGASSLAPLPPQVPRPHSRPPLPPPPPGLSQSP